jgi:predicted transcriptional regulator
MTTDFVSLKARRSRINRKDRSQSISSILGLLNGQPLRQSSIVQKSGLTYKQVKKYVILLTNCNLIYYNGQDLTYKTTAKGLHYLNLQNSMVELLQITKTNSNSPISN